MITVKNGLLALALATISFAMSANANDSGSVCVLTEPTSQACKDLGLQQGKNPATGADFLSVPSAKIASVQLFAATSSADVNSWCARTTTGTGGRNSVSLTLQAAQPGFSTGYGGQFQIGKDFNVILQYMSGSSNATVEFSDGSFSQTISPATAGGNIFKIPANTTIGTITVKASGGGRPDPTCQEITVFRAQNTYTPHVSVDKTSVGSQESFQLTISGLPTVSTTQAAFMPVGNWSVTHSAPSSASQIASIKYPKSCMNPSPVVSICSSEDSMHCTRNSYGTDGTETYICQAASTADSGVDKSDIVYTFSYGARSAVDVFLPSNTVDVTVKKEGTGGTPTEYGNCPEGKGLDPNHVANGCVACGYIEPESVRKGIKTCTAGPAGIYKWRITYVGQSQTMAPPACANPAPSEDMNNPSACSSLHSACTANGKIFTCKDDNAPTDIHSGHVVDYDTGAPIAGVNVMGMTGYDSSMDSCIVTTDSAGNWALAKDGKNCEYASNFIRYTKDGYVEERIPPIPGEQNTVRLHKTCTLTFDRSGNYNDLPGTSTKTWKANGCPASTTYKVVWRTTSGNPACGGSGEHEWSGDGVFSGSPAGGSSSYTMDDSLAAKALDGCDRLMTYRAYSPDGWVIGSVDAAPVNLHYVGKY